MSSKKHRHHVHEHELPDEEAVEFGSYLQMERMLRHIQRLAGARDFADAEAAGAFMATLSESDLKRAATALQKDPKGMAQEFAYEALEAEDEEEALSFAEQALKLDPSCVDAMQVIAECHAETPEEMIAQLQPAVRASDEAAKAILAKPQRSPFWDLLELSPYMRVHSRVGDLLRLTNRAPEAIGHFEAMLHLDPDDNYGARDLLLACYLQERQLGKTRELLTRFADDQSATMLWAATLERYLSEDLQGAATALAIAQEQNPHVAEHLARREAPDSVPTEEYEPGDENEALHCADTIGMAWMKYPKASKWLAGRIGE